MKIKLWVHPPLTTKYNRTGNRVPVPWKDKRGVGSEISRHDPEGGAYGYLPACLAHALLKNHW